MITGRLLFQALFNFYETADSTSSPLVNANSRTVLFDGIDLSSVLSTGGDIDLVGVPLARNTATTKDMTGKKLVAWGFKCPIGNAAGVVVKVGATNAYNLFGSASDRLTLGPGRGAFSALDAATDPADIDTPAVAGGAKNIRISGTVADIVTGFLVFATP
jgi:hypothetical protein